MAIIKDGKEYEYNIDGDLVPKGSVTLENMYGDFESRWVPQKKVRDPEWKKAVDKLFGVIDPLAGNSKEECDKAVVNFFVIADCNPNAEHFNKEDK